MRIDPQHAEKLRRAIIRNEDGEPEIRFNIAFMRTAFSRLTPWEIGVLTQSLMRAASAKKRTQDQRALLAMFVHNEHVDGGTHG